MGKPIREARAEVATTVERTRAAIELAPQVLAPERLGPRGGIEREIEHLPLGVVLDIAAWNYPLLTAVNVVVPALLAGNAVILKHSSRTPLCAGHFARAFAEAGAPTDLVSALIADHQVTAELIGDEEIAYVAFTGSVAGGRAISTAARGRFIDIGLELGGKDPAYVRADADVEAAAEAIADGAFYNAGQSSAPSPSPVSPSSSPARSRTPSASAPAWKSAAARPRSTAAAATSSAPFSQASRRTWT